MDDHLRAELYLLLIIWIKDVFEARGDAILVLVFHCNGSVVEEDHSYAMSAYSLSGM